MDWEGGTALPAGGDEDHRLAGPMGNRVSVRRGGEMVRGAALWTLGLPSPPVDGPRGGGTGWARGSEQTPDERNSVREGREGGSGAAGGTRTPGGVRFALLGPGMLGEGERGRERGSRRAELRAGGGRGEVEPPVGLEPTTVRLQGGCSTTELRRRLASRWILPTRTRASHIHHGPARCRPRRRGGRPRERPARRTPPPRRRPRRRGRSLSTGVP